MKKKTPKPSQDFQRFDKMLRKVLAVPKSEIDKREKVAKERKEQEKKG